MGQTTSNVKTPLPITKRTKEKCELAPDDIKEENLDGTIVKDDGCFFIPCSRCLERHVVIKDVEFYICYDCEVYFCGDCLGEHENHNGTVRNGQNEEVDSFIAHMLVENDRETKLMMGDALLIDEINVKCNLDRENCAINTLCLLGNQTLAMCDFLNNCIKIFSAGSYELQRYIRLGTFPWGMTEIKQPLTETDHVDDSILDTYSQTNGLLAITIPKINQIWFIDLSKTTAEKTKAIEPGLKCLDITYNNDKLFAMCRERPSPTGAVWFVCILNRSGNVERYIKTDITLVLSLFPSTYKTPRMTVDNGKIYITTYWTNKVHCIEVEGDNTTKITSSINDVTGICSDNHTNIYACSLQLGKVYRMDTDLNLCDQVRISPDFFESPGTLSFGKDKLFVANHYQSLAGNIVAVIALID